MEYKKGYRGKNQNLLFILITASTFVFVIAIIISSIMEYAPIKDVKGNMFYIDVINYNFPVVKEISYDEDDLAESTGGIRERLLGALNLNIKNPAVILEREMSYFKTPMSSGSKMVAFNPFKLKTEDIQKDLTDGTFNVEKKANEGTGTGNTNTVVPVYDAKLKKQLDTSKPEVLIYHTHTTESYLPSQADSEDPTKNVCAVGDALQNELESNYGISVIHDKTDHNSFAYNQAYIRSGETVDKYLKKYGDFKIIIDLHRDSVDNKNAVTMKLNGENVAKFMFVLSQKNNPHFAKNFALANSLFAIANKLYPGFCRQIYVYPSGQRAFNQSKSNNALLFEVGTYSNDLSEVKASAKYLARIIGEYLNGKS